MSKEIEAQVVEFLASVGISYSMRLVGATTRDKWECDEWRVSFKAARIDFITEFFTGTGRRVDTGITAMQRRSLKGCSHNSIAWQEMLKGMKPVAPSAAIVLHSLVSDGRAIDQSFIDWCDEYGMDPDSRKALSTYEACCESGRKLRTMFTRAQMETLTNLLQDY